MFDCFMLQAAAVEAAHAQLRTAASPAHCIGDRNLLPNLDGGMHGNVSTVGPGMDAIPETENTQTNTAQDLQRAQVTVKGFGYGDCPSSISF